MEGKGGFEDRMGSATTSCRGLDLGPLQLGHHQPQCGHPPQGASPVGSEGRVLTSGTAQAGAVPSGSGHTGLSSGPRLVV